MMEPVAWAWRNAPDDEFVATLNEPQFAWEKQPLVRLSDAEARIAEARDEALEEAAKVAERFEAEYASERDKHVHGTPDHWMNNSGSYAAMDIAAAVRALKASP